MSSDDSDERKDISLPAEDLRRSVPRKPPGNEWRPGLRPDPVGVAEGRLLSVVVVRSGERARRRRLLPSPPDFGRVKERRWPRFTGWLPGVQRFTSYRKIRKNQRNPHIRVSNKQLTKKVQKKVQKKSAKKSEKKWKKVKREKKVGKKWEKIGKNWKKWKKLKKNGKNCKKLKKNGKIVWNDWFGLENLKKRLEHEWLNCSAMQTVKSVEIYSPERTVMWAETGSWSLATAAPVTAERVKESSPTDWQSAHVPPTFSDSDSESGPSFYASIPPTSWADWTAAPRTTVSAGRSTRRSATVSRTGRPVDCGRAPAANAAGHCPHETPERPWRRSWAVSVTGSRRKRRVSRLAAETATSGVEHRERSCVWPRTSCRVWPFCFRPWCVFCRRLWWTTAPAAWCARWRGPRRWSVSAGLECGADPVRVLRWYVSPSHSSALWQKKGKKLSQWKSQVRINASNQPSNQSMWATNQAINQSIKDSINQSIDRDITHLLTHSLNQSMDQAINHYQADVFMQSQ